MRVLVLSLLVASSLTLASDAGAQTAMSDPFMEQTYGPPQPGFSQAFDFPHIPPQLHFQKAGSLAFNEQGSPVLSAGNGWYVSAHGESYRPIETMRIRSDGIGFTRELSEGTTITIGTERSKLSLEGLPRLRTLDYGFRLRVSF